jgi:hypothetical protein
VSDKHLIVNRARLQPQKRRLACRVPERFSRFLLEQFEDDKDSEPKQLQSHGLRHGRCLAEIDWTISWPSRFSEGCLWLEQWVGSMCPTRHRTVPWPIQYEGNGSGFLSQASRLCGSAKMGRAIERQSDTTGRCSDGDFKNSVEKSLSNSGGEPSHSPPLSLPVTLASIQPSP